MELRIDGISHLYNYTAPPPHGAGGHGKLVLETVSRSIQYARANPSPHYEIGVKGERLFSQTHKGNCVVTKDVQGFYNEKMATSMIANFIIKNRQNIDEAISETIQWAHSTSISELGKGRQTLEVISGQCMKASAALERFCQFLNLNGLGTDFSLISFCDAIWKLYEKEEIVIQRPVYSKVPKVLKGSRTYFRGKDYVFKKEVIEEKFTGEEKNIKIFDMMRTFETFRKDGERNKSVRRAIASPGIPLRAFLRIIEEFGKRLCKRLPESTISIGGDEKKDRIQQLLNSAVAKSTIYPAKFIITGDNSKWNETQSPQLMKLVMDMFCTSFKDWYSVNKDKTGLYYKNLLNKISDTLFSVIFQKRVKTGVGFKIENKKENICKYITLDELLKNKQWWNDDEALLEPCEDIVTDETMLTVSPGMIMGMLNIFSTIIGLIASSYNNRGEHDSKYREDYKKGLLHHGLLREDLIRILMLTKVDQISYPRSQVLHLQSSDDFFTIVLGYDKKCALSKISELFSNNKIMGINWSIEKTMIREMKVLGVGEYTSWFVQGGRLIPQWGSDTAQLRPFGSNCQSDLATATKNILSKLTTRNINYFGADIALRVHCRLLRVLYRITYGSTPMGLSPELVCFANGGTWKYTPSKLHLDETAILLYKLNLFKTGQLTTYTEEEVAKFEKYIRRLLNPCCPLNASVTTMEEFDTELMELVQKEFGIIMNCNNIQLRSNAKLTNKKMEETKRRKIYGLVEKLAVYIRPTLSAIGSNAKIPLKEILVHQLMSYDTKFETDESQEGVLNRETVSYLREFFSNFF